MLHDRRFIGLAGIPAIGVAQLADAVEDSLGFNLSTLLGIGGVVAFLALNLPIRRAEFMAYRARTVAAVTRAFETGPTAPGAHWILNATCRLVDRALAGHDVDVVDLDEIADATRDAAAWRMELYGVDEHAEHRNYGLEFLDRWRAAVIAAGEPSSGMAPEPEEQPRRDRRLRDKRRAAFLTQADLAAKMGVTTRTVLRWEHGEIEPSRPHRRMLAAILGGRQIDYQWERD